MSLVYVSKGDYTKAMECYEDLKKIGLDLGDKRVYSIAVGNMGNLFFAQGLYTRAMEHYEEYKKVCLELGDTSGYSMAIGNMGNVSFKQGEYTKAIEYYEEQKKICLELGDKSGYSMAVDDIGDVYNEQGNYTKAIECYEEAINVGREFNIKRNLCDYLYSKAKLLYTLKEYENAKSTNNEANQMAIEVQRKDIVFSSTLLSHKLQALENPKEAVTNLTQMLSTETEDENVAAIHYEIYQINHSDEHRHEALERYQKLYAKTPNIDYKEKIEELNQYSGGKS